MKIEIEIGSAVRKVFGVISTVVFILLGLGLGNLGILYVQLGCKWYSVVSGSGLWGFMGMWSLPNGLHDLGYILLNGIILLVSALVMFYFAYRSLRQLRAKKLDT